MVTFRRTVGIALALSVSACASPSTRISSELVRYGLDARQASCVGDRLEANLSIAQLQQLGRAAAAHSNGGGTPGRLTIADLSRASGQINDPKVTVEVASAAAGCGVLASALSNL